MSAVGARVLHVSLFGSLRLRYGGEPLMLAAPPKATPLLAALLLDRDDAIGRERLAFALWPDEPGSNARANLRRHLHYLSRALPDAGAPWFHADARAVRWNPELPLQLDVARFEVFLSGGDRTAAAELYAGDLLADLDEEWLDGERARLRALHLENLASLLAAEASARRHAAVAQVARRLLECDPWREDALRALMAARFELGDRAAALAAYDTFEDTLRGEIGTDPMPETQALRERIAAEELVFPIEAPRRASSVATLTPFVGRDDELGRLRAAYRNARYGHGGTVLVAGEAGIGKSRLVAAFRACVEREGGAFAGGSTSTPESGPYEAVLDALGAIAPAIAAAGLNELRLRTLAAALHALATLRPGLEAPPDLDPAQLRDRLFDAVAEALRAVARRTPLVVALEDLHWAGHSTCALVGALAERVADVPVVLIVTYRDEDVPSDHPLLEVSRRVSRSAEHLAMRPFHRDEVGRFVSAATGIATLPDDQAARFHEQSDGNPFALGQMLRDGLESGAIRIANGAVVADALGLPRAVEQVLADRVERLSPPARALAQIAAVVGRRFARDVIARASGLGESRTASALGELLDRQLAHDAGKGEFAFLHHTIVDAIYRSSHAADLPLRHRRVAEALEAFRGDEHDDLAHELAHHWERAGEQGRAARFHLRAARRALALFAHDEAGERLEFVIAHADDARTIADALLLREELARRAGDRVAQERNLTAAEESDAVAADEELRCEVLRRRAQWARVVGDRAAEAKAIEALEKSAAALGSRHWETVGLLLRASADIATGRLDRARVALGRVRGLDTGADMPLAIDVRCQLAEIAIHRAEYDEAERVLDEAWTIAGDDETLRYRVVHQRHGIARARESFDRVHLIARELLAYSQRIGDRRAEMFNHLRLANAALFIFEIAEAREHYAIADRMAQTLGSPRDRTTIAICRGILAHALGEVDEERRQFENAHAIAARYGDAFGRVLSDINLAAADYAQGAYGNAVVRASACVEPATALGALEIEAAAHCTVGAALRCLGQAREAVASLERGVALQRAAGLRWTIGQDLAELTMAQLAADDAGATASAVDELCALAETGCGGLTQPQFMLRVAGEAARALGDRARAEQLFAQSEATYQDRLDRIPDEATRRSFAAAWFNVGLVPVDAL